MNPLGTASVLGSRFRLIEPVRGSAPDGAWRAADKDSGAEVAIKPLGAYPAGDGSARARFRHAARALLQLSGPGIAPVRDYGESAMPGDRILLYLVRDVVSGQTLDQRLAGGPLPASEALRVAAAVAAALAAAHQAGVPHGHLVPANIVISGSTVTVTDFGLPTRPLDHGGTGDQAGLSYRAPELGDGRPATPAADMYALGVIFVACLAGIGSAATRPEPAGTGAGSAAPGGLAQEPVPAAIAALWASCLGPDPGQRPTAARAVALSGQVLPGQAHASGQAQGSPQLADPTRTRDRYAQRLRTGLATRGRRLAGAGAAAALAAMAGGAFLVSSLNAQPAARISSVTATGTPSAAAPTGAPGTGGNSQTASPPATVPAVPALPAVPAGLPSAAALAALQQFGSSIRADVAAGQIRSDVGLDMDNLILPVLTQLATGQPAPVQQLVSTLRAKIATRLGEGGLTTQAASQLTGELSTLQSSAGAGS